MIIPPYNKNNGLSLVLLDIWNKTNEQRKRWASKKTKKKYYLFIINSIICTTEFKGKTQESS